MYLGELEIKTVVRVPEQENKVKITFEGEHPDTIMDKDMLDSLTTEEKGRGNVTDNVNHKFASKFIAELASNGLEYYVVDNVAMAMRVLAHNLREEAIKKAFKCSGGDNILLSDLLPDEE